MIYVFCVEGSNNDYFPNAIMLFVFLPNKTQHQFFSIYSTPKNWIKTCYLLQYQHKVKQIQFNKLINFIHSHACTKMDNCIGRVFLQYFALYCFCCLVCMYLLHPQIHVLPTFPPFSFFTLLHFYKLSIPKFDFF